MTNWIDETQHKIVHTFFVPALSAEQIESAANDMLFFLQPLTRLKLLSVSANIDLDVQIQPEPALGSFRKQLLVLCETHFDGVLGRTFQYKFRLANPDPAMLDGKGQRLDLGSVMGQTLVQFVLLNTSDLRGNMFAKVINSSVIKF